jgi:hypothetical protein
MKQGYLSQYFKGVAAKALSAVESDTSTSNQHEFNSAMLTMLGVKSTCKDRWRQVLVEARRIPNKHLLTLEAAISENQTHEMQSNSLQLVVPVALRNTYSPRQQNWLMNLTDFVGLVKKRQER